MTLPLQAGDEIRVIALSQSWLANRRGLYEKAAAGLEKLGYRVTYGNYIKSSYRLNTAKAADRLEDFTNAYSDPMVRAVMALNGGWSANELLPLIDWELISSNPKPLIGYSDITVLLNAIYEKTGVISYVGPNFGTLGYETSRQYTVDGLQAALQQRSLEIQPSRQWDGGSQKKLLPTQWNVFRPGEASGVLLGGNLGSFYLLQGTEYQPTFSAEYILAIEDDNEAGKYTAHEISRRLESILQLPNARKNLRGLIVGRLLPESKVDDGLLAAILNSKHMGNIPILTGVDFGHTLPMMTLPIGGQVRLIAGKNGSAIVT